MSRTNEEIAATTAEKCYDLAHGEYPMGYADAETKIALLILAALNESNAQRDAELKQWRSLNIRHNGCVLEDPGAIEQACAEKDAENARLREEVEQWRAEYYKHRDATVPTVIAQRDHLRAALDGAKEALGQVLDYGKDHDGCCPYGCDTPHIAQQALARIDEVTKGQP